MTFQPAVADAANHRLVSHVRPPGWATVPGRSEYDLVVIGGGTAGLVTAMGAAGVEARVALIERGMLGGDCLTVGCVPSKAILRSARAVDAIRGGAGVGVHAPPPRVEFGAVMARMRVRRAAIAEHDSAARLAAAGVDVVFGEASFADRRHVTVNGRRVRFGRAVIATGGRPAAPPVPGLAEAGYLTNETVFELTTLPPRLLVVGAGAIGCELAQAFAAFGSQVTVVDVAPRVLAREDADAAAIIHRRLVREGARLELGVPLREIRPRSGGGGIAVWERDGRDTHAEFDAVLVAAGRRPNVETLNLGAAGVETTRDGVRVDDRLRTTNPRIFAAGDVASPYKFTHAADAQARLVIRNALFFGRARASGLVIPWCTYTMPEVAHVGISAEAAAEDARVATITVPLSDVDRAVVDDETEGFVRVHHAGGRIRGCTIVAPHAGELIGYVAYVMRTGGTLGDLSATIFPYPTYAEALRKAGDAYMRSRLTPAVRALLRLVLAIRR